MSRQNIVSSSVIVSSLLVGCGYFANFDGPLPPEPTASNAGASNWAGAGNVAGRIGGTAGGVAGYLGGVAGNVHVFAGNAGVGDAGQASVGGAGRIAATGGASSNSVGGSSTAPIAGGAAGTTTTSGAGGAPVTCAESETRSCSQGGLLGTCAPGIQRCIAGQWSACSIAPAARDTCTPGNDDNCNGKPNDTACSVLQVVAGSTHTCALLSDGMVRCWGANYAGQLGNGTTTLSGTPVLVRDLNGVSSIAAGGDNTCAVLMDGSVRCWGQRADGLLGENQSGVSTLPTALTWSFTLPVSLVTIGGGFACAITKAEATVRCWGRGDLGQLGDGLMHIERVPNPVMALGVAGVTSLSAGSSHACAALSDSTVKCWGTGEHGENGSVDYSSASTPIELADHGYRTTDVRRVTVGDDHSCGLDMLGRALCWGSNVTGQLGVGDRAFGSYDGKFTQAARWLSSDHITNAGGVAALSAGANHTCAVLVDGGGICWGSNVFGQLGNGFKG
ncbi:MAG TPA: hypothetical protein VKP30_32645, partial [Polyangiaceae bacterium]|nr:hypothetical protein [Polyangiaceae bacterium]